MLVFVEQGMGAQSRHQMVHQHDVAAGIQRIAFWQQTQLAQHIFRMLMALLAQADGVVFLIHPVIALAIFFFLTHQVSRHLVHGLIHLNVVVGLTRNDQWRTRFVNQNRIDLIDHGKIQRNLYTLFLRAHHIVTQVVKAKFIVGTVANV